MEKEISVSRFHAKLVFRKNATQANTNKRYRTISTYQWIPDTYKPKLEDILHDVIIISEIAELAEEAEHLPENTHTFDTKEILKEGLKATRKQSIAQVRWSEVRFHKRDPSIASEDDIGDDKDTGSASSDPQQKSPSDPPRKTYESTSVGPRSGAKLERSRSGSIRIKNLLDRWDEPKNLSDKSSEASIHDILKFRRALTLLNLEKPFGDAYGPASNRNESIQSSANVFQKLLKLSPGSALLSYDVLKVLAENDDGTEDYTKKKTLRQLFRPDAKDELTMLAFIQSCDTVYKKIRYFRASGKITGSRAEGTIPCFPCG